MSAHYNRLALVQNGTEENPGYGDYDIPKPAREMDYAIPKTKKERERESIQRAMGILPPAAQADTTTTQALVDRPGSDYAIPVTKEERDRREKSLLGRSSETSSLSGDSRPISLASSIYSTDTSSFSYTSSGSRTNIIQKEDAESEYSTLKPANPPLETQGSLELDEQLEAIDQLVEGISEQRNAKKKSTTLVEEEEGEAYELPSLGKMLNSARSSFSENGSSSRSGSNDNLGVWDDISYEDEEDSGDESSSGGDAGSGGDAVSGGDAGSGEGNSEEGNSGEEALLDSWIKELESGAKGMAKVAGLSPEAVVSYRVCLLCEILPLEVVILCCEWFVYHLESQCGLRYVLFKTKYLTQHGF